MSGESSGPVDPVLARYAEAARWVDEGRCACAPDGSPFGAGHYDDLDDIPNPAVRISLGCGDPLAVADLHETPPASPFTSEPGSASSDDANASGSSTECGETLTYWNDAAARADRSTTS